MPYPSRGCRTCRQRRVKCDEARPVCKQCSRLGRDCGGYDRDNGPFSFINENVYAGGVGRRPRLPKATLDLSSARVVKNRTLPEGFLEINLVLQGPSRITLSIPPSIVLPLEDEALHAFRARYAQPCDETMNSMWSQIFILSEGARMKTSEVNTVFKNAISASSLAFLAKIRCESTIMDRANYLYVQALHGLKTCILHPANSTSDQILLATLLLSNYENLSARPEESQSICESFKHMDGAIALLRLRRRRQAVTPARLSLDRHIRAQIVKQAVYRGTLIPTWLRSGEEFGIEDIELLLDKCIVKVALLRHNVNYYLQSLKQLSRLGIQTTMKQLQKALCDAHSLHKQLIEWSKRTPQDYAYELFMYTDAQPEYQPLYFRGMSSVYTSIRHANMWNQYRGTRLIASCIIAKIANTISAIDETLRDNMQMQLDQMWNDQQILIDEICASVPYVLVEGSLVPSAYKAFILSWPLIIVLAVPNFPNEQRQWVRDKLRLISNITASGMFMRVANLDLHLHQNPICAEH